LPLGFHCKAEGDLVTQTSGVRISMMNGVWQVVITVENCTEHKSFSTESEAKAYADTRIEYLRQTKQKSPFNGA